MTVDTCFVVPRHICRIRETVSDFLDLPPCVTPAVLQVVPYKECKQGLEPQEFSETVLTPKKFIEKECIQNKWGIT